jgi:hypothetical protein
MALNIIYDRIKCDPSNFQSGKHKSFFVLGANWMPLSSDGCKQKYVKSMLLMKNKLKM